MKKTMMLCLISALLFLPTLALASITIELDVKDSFTVGEMTYFDYTLNSDVGQKVIFKPYIACPEAPAPFFEEKEVDLAAGEPYHDTYFGINVDDSVSMQTCNAYIEVISPTQKREERQFRIETEPVLEFTVLACKDSACFQKSKIFNMGEKIYLDYDSKVSDLKITGKLTRPDKTVSQINLPASLTANQIGTYDIEITAVKEGYKKTSAVSMFGVIAKETNILSTSVCNANSVCSGDENYRNCPQDCPSGSSDKYCDNLADNKCDPDCSIAVDPDCGQERDMSAVIAVALVIGLAMLLILYAAVRHYKK